MYSQVRDFENTCFGSETLTSALTTPNKHPHKHSHKCRSLVWAKIQYFFQGMND